MPCQVHTHVELAFPGYNSMIIAAWLYPSCEVTQTLEFHTSESLEVMLHIGHVLEWPVLLDAPPLLLVWPQILEEHHLQFFPLPLQGGGVVVVVVCPKNMI